MVTNQIVLTSAGAAVLVSTSAEDLVACPHCGAGIVLDEIEVEPGCLAVACPHCEKRSLLVRLVSVLHRAVCWPGELLAQFEGRSAGVGATGVRMPEEVFTLPVSRGAVALLAMLWHRAERMGSTTVESSVAQLARRQLSSRGMIRRWMSELTEAGALREVTPDGSPSGHREWELLTLEEKGGRDD